MNNGERIMQEFVDLCATLALLGLFTPSAFDTREFIDAVQRKQLKVQRYLEFAGQLGTLVERRKDGWPLCPVCGEDELWSSEVPANAAGDLRCYRCRWSGRVDEPKSFEPPTVNNEVV